MPHWAKVTKPLKKKGGSHYVLGSKTKNRPSSLAKGLYFDNNVSILSRMYDNDRERIVDRANNLGVCGMLCWHPDVEKCEELFTFCSLKPSLCLYYMLGVHPDNISRTNKTLQDAWHLKIDEFSRESNCIAIYSGVNYSREPQSHFAQESMLRCLYHQAVSLGTPLVLFINSKDIADIDKQKGHLIRIMEILGEEGWIAGAGSSSEASCSVPLIVQDVVATCRCDLSVLSLLVDAGVYFSVSLSEAFQLPENTLGEDPTSLSSENPLLCALQLIPRERLLLSSCSPTLTPQNIPDEHIRNSKNEPSNFDYIVKALAPYIGVCETELAELNRNNSARVYNLKGADDGISGDSGTGNTAGCSNKVGRGRSREDADADADAHSAVLGSGQDHGGIGAEGVSALSLAHIHLDDDQACANSADVEGKGVSEQHFMCSKCHHVLFGASHRAHPHVSGTTTLAAAVDCDSTGNVTLLCSAVYFLPVALLGCCSGCYVDSLGVDNQANVSCNNCSTKLGKQILPHVADDFSIVSCPCGYEIPQDDVSSLGGLLRLASTKIKLVESALSSSAAAEPSNSVSVENEEKHIKRGRGHGHGHRDKSRSNTIDDEPPAHIKGGKKTKQGKKK